MKNEKQNASFDMVMQSATYHSLPERQRKAWESWSPDRSDDFEHVANSDLTLGEETDLLNWISHNRDSMRLCDQLGETY